MSLIFRKRIKLFAGLYLNLSKRGVSLTHKVGPVSVNTRRGRTPRVSVDGPGGLGWVSGGRSTRRRSQARRDPVEVRTEASLVRGDEDGARQFNPYS